MTTAARHAGMARRWDRRALRRTLGLIALLVLAIAAWVYLAPSRFGGETTYALVTGHSMEPTLHDGTLVVARSRPEYRVGQVVVYQMHGGHVMHRLVAGSATEGFVTRGDNNEYNDPWHVTPDEILGEVVATIPLAGAGLTWTAAHPVVTALLAAAVVLLSLIPRRRRVVSPELARVLPFAVTETATPESSVLRPALWAGYAMTVLCLAAAVFALATHARVWPTLTLTLGALIVCAAGLEYLEAVLYDGRGLPPAQRAAIVLSGRSRWLATRIPADGSFTDAREPIRVDTPERLRDLSIAYRIPVLHRVDPVSARSDYVLVTSRADYRWQPARGHRADPRVAESNVRYRAGRRSHQVGGPPGTSISRPSVKPRPA